MLPVFILAYYVVVVVVVGDDARSASSIQLRDAEFLGEDRVLRAALAARRSPAARRPLPPLDLARPANRRRLEMLQDTSPHYLALVSNRSRSQAARRSENQADRKNDPFIYEPNTRMSMALCLQIMQQSIYSVQYRYMDVRSNAEKYGNDTGYRIAFLLRTMHNQLFEMRVWHKYLSNPKNYGSWRDGGTAKAMRYYQFMLRNHIDITQAWHHVLYLHDMRMRKRDKVRPTTPKPRKNQTNTTTYKPA